MKFLKFQVRNYIVLASFLSIFVGKNSLAEYPFTDLVDTYTILKPGYKHLSPIFGFIWYKHGILANYYSHGVQEDAMIKLIHKLFFRLAEHAEVNPTNKRSNLGRYLTPKTIGIIMAAIESDPFKKAAKYEKINILVDVLQTEAKILGEAVNTPAYRKRLKELEKKQKSEIEKSVKEQEFIEFVTQDPAGQKLLAGKPYAAQLGFAEFQEEAQQGAPDIPEKDIANWFNRLKRPEKERIQKIINGRIKEISETFFLSELFRKFEKFATLLVDAFEESSPLSKDPKAMIFSTHCILLSYLYARTRSREDMKNYFDQLQPYLKEGATFEIKREQYSKKTYQEFRDQMIKWLKNPGDINTFFANDQWYERAIFSGITGQIYAKRFPPFMRDQDRSEYRFNDKSHYFTDCAENSIRHFFNFILKKPEEISFDLILLDNTVGNVTLKDTPKSKLFKEFYGEKFTTVEFIETPGAHDEWNQIVEGIPGVGYVIRPDGSRNEKEPSYAVFENDGHAELEPNIAHIVTIFRYLFNMPNFEQYLIDNNIKIEKNQIIKNGLPGTFQEELDVFKHLIEQFSRKDLVITAIPTESDKQIYTFSLTDTTTNITYKLDWHLNPKHGEMAKAAGEPKGLEKEEEWRQELLDLVLNDAIEVAEKTLNGSMEAFEKAHKYLSFIAAYYQKGTARHAIRKLTYTSFPIEEYQWLTQYMLFMNPITSRQNLFKKKSKLIKYIIKSTDDEWVAANSEWIVSFVHEIAQGTYGKLRNPDRIYVGKIVLKLIRIIGIDIALRLDQEIKLVLTMHTLNPKYIDILLDIVGEFLELGGKRFLESQSEAMEQFIPFVGVHDFKAFMELIRDIMKYEGSEWLKNRPIWLINTLTHVIETEKQRPHDIVNQLYRVLGTPLLNAILKETTKQNVMVATKFLKLVRSAKR